MRRSRAVVASTSVITSVMVGSYGSRRAVAVPVRTSTPSWLVVETAKSATGVPSPSSRMAVDLGGGGERVARPHLLDEAHAVAEQPAVADPVGEDAAGHAHGQHPVGEHARVAGDLAW